LKRRVRVVVSLVAVVAFTSALQGGGTDPLSSIPAEQREALNKRLGAYVEAYRGMKWDKLYDLVSDTGREGANRQTFIAAMKSEHGTDFAQMPDLLEFKLDRAEKNGDGHDIYGCGKAQRERMKFNGIVVVHTVFEHNNWSFTGWRFTEFPNEPCEALSDPKWQPANRGAWHSPMEEIVHFKSQGVPFHQDPPH
jgi:hypothetical protein